MSELRKPIAFLATKHAAAAREFYEDLLGLRLVADEPFALVFDLEDAPLRIQKVEEVLPAPYTALGWLVDDLRQTIAFLEKRGVVFDRFDMLAQDEHGIWEAPGGTKVAWFRDPDGNMLSLTEEARA